MQTTTTSTTSRRAHIAGGLMVFASPFLFLFALFAAALAFGGMGHEPAQPSVLDVLLVLLLLAVPVSGFVLGGALVCNQQWARKPAIALAALSSAIWLLAPFFVPALVLLCLDLESDRRRNRAVAA